MVLGLPEVARGLDRNHDHDHNLHRDGATARPQPDRRKRLEVGCGGVAQRQSLSYKEQTDRQQREGRCLFPAPARVRHLATAERERRLGASTSFSSLHIPNPVRPWFLGFSSTLHRRISFLFPFPVSLPYSPTKRASWHGPIPSSKPAGRCRCFTHSRSHTHTHTQTHMRFLPVSPSCRLRPRVRPAAGHDIHCCSHPCFTGFLRMAPVAALGLLNFFF